MEQITFCSRKDVIHVDKTNGTSVNYYIFPEYEVHTNCIAPHSVQEWHYHEKISETLLITKGKLLCRYLEGTDQHSRYHYEGDLVQVGNSIHTFENDTEEEVQFIVFRFVPDGTDKREVIKRDKKVVVENI